MGVTVISVGVGTGGWSSTGGDGSIEITVLGGAVVGIGAEEGAVAGGITVEGTGRGRNWTSVSGCDAAPRCGAAPIAPFPPPSPRPPVPAGAPTEAGRDGVASVQPTRIEIGKPTATIPTKTDLGDKRTLRTPVGWGKRLRPNVLINMDRDRYCSCALACAGVCNRSRGNE
jgi:hypothetical protein